MGSRYTEAVPNEHKTKREIIEKLGKERQIERWIENIKKTSLKKNSLNDLAQDVYIILYSMDDEKIETLYEKGELPFFANRILLNQLNSTTSTYYYRYIKPNSLHIEDIVLIESAGQTDNNSTFRYKERTVGD